MACRCVCVIGVSSEIPYPSRIESHRVSHRSQTGTTVTLSGVGGLTGLNDTATPFPIKEESAESFSIAAPPDLAGEEPCLRCLCCCSLLCDLP